MVADKTWYEVDNSGNYDSPALFIYPSRVLQNIKRLTTQVNTSQLRPHVKTNKIAEVCLLMMEQGIVKFKAATIAEAEMLGIIHAPDVLLAYPLTKQKIKRFICLIQTYPETKFSCLVDSIEGSESVSSLFRMAGLEASVFIDLNVGMFRTGILPENAFKLFQEIELLPNLKLVGLHAYDGHIRDKDYQLRRQKCVNAFEAVIRLRTSIEKHTGKSIVLIAGGSPTSFIHASFGDREYSPGTFVFWDKGYADQLPEQPFEFAAIVFCRVVSIPDAERVCVDLGYKSVSSENPLPRVFFLNAPEAMPVAHSEEHLVLKVEDSGKFRIGDGLYGIPFHICPTVALYDQAFIVEKNLISGTWKITARPRQINI
jgi:D-threonine aldolase